MKIDLIQGDCLEKMQYIPDKSVDLVLTDIPYDGVNRESNGLRNLDKGKADIMTIELKDLIPELLRINRGSGYIFCGWGQISEIIDILKERKLSTRLCVWQKTNPSPMNGQSIWLSGVEYCIYWKNKNATFNEYCKNVVWNFPSGRNKIHPTEKPLKLFEYLINVSSNEGDTILDPFMGSGTTIVACKNLNRNGIGIELDQAYFEIAKKRIEETPTKLFY
jgi:DNA modification methylase